MDTKLMRRFPDWRQEGYPAIQNFATYSDKYYETVSICMHFILQDLQNKQLCKTDMAQILTTSTIYYWVQKC